ncbi:AAA family ATPase [Aquifex pyrophilus]
MRKLVVVMGLSGSGKSFLSSILNEEFGYKWLRSDVIRKEIMGIKPEKSAKAVFGKGIYTEDITRKVYEEMVRRAKELYERCEKVVLDATFLKKWQRELVLKNFKDPLFIWAYAPEEVIKKRLEKRKDVSDADFNIYLKQKEVFEIPEEVIYIKVNTDKTYEELKEELKRIIGGA